MSSKEAGDAGGPGNGGAGWLLGATAVFAVWFGLRLLLDVFSVAGIAYTLGLGDGATLMWPTATAVLTWMLAIEICAAAGMAADVATGKRRPTRVAYWVFGHVTFMCWIGQLFLGLWRIAFRGGTRLTARWPQPASAPDDDGAEDFAAFDVVSVEVADGVPSRRQTVMTAEPGGASTISQSQS